jgi:hypothetical protein
MVDDQATNCIEACLDLAAAAGAAASHCLRWGGTRSESHVVNSLVTCSAVARMIAEKLQMQDAVDDSLVALGIDVSRSATRICAEIDDPELRPCQLAAGACVDALRAVQAGY